MRWLLSLVCAAVMAQTNPLDDDLLAAARKGDLPAVKTLLEKGAALEAKSRYGQTPLFFAARGGHEELVKFLLSKGAQTKVNDTFYKMSLLAAAADKGYTGIVKALLDAGSDGAADALEAAAERGNQEMATMVIATGKVKPEQMTAALTAAQRAKQPAIEELLTKAGAKPAPKPSAQVSEDQLKSYVGTYKGDPIGEMSFVLKEGKLFLNVQGQSLELGAFDDTNFGLLVNPGVKLQFKLTDGKVTGVNLLQGGQTLSMTRVEGK
jgi:ankyrin repeat protein